MAYSSMYHVFKDAALYFIVNKGGNLTLSLMPTITRGRWSWFVENYNKFKDRFKTYANGDQILELALEDLNKYVDGYKLGNENINPFDIEANLITFKPFLDIVNLGEIGLTPSETFIRDEELDRVSKLEEIDFRSMIDLVKKTATLYAQDIGLGDDSANEYYGITSRKKRRSVRVEDINNLNDLTEVEKFIEGYIFDKQLQQKRPPNVLKLTQENLLSTSGFRPEDIYKTYTPAPFEISLESMAKKYLGSAEKWYELVTVNNLKPPFYDPIGAKYYLLAPAASNNLIIPSTSKDEIAPGVAIALASHKYQEEVRTIERVIFNEDDTMVLFLSGAPDLNKFSPNEKAFARIFKAGTVRQNSIILIPSSVGSNGVSTPTPTRDDLRRLEKAFIEFGVDIARDNHTGDLQFDLNGNFKLAFGYQAVRQAVLNTIKTEVGELNFHPTYGMNFSLGRSYLGSVDSAVQIGDLIVSAILRDPRFADARISKISSTNTSASLQVSVKIRGFDDAITLAFVS